MTLSKHTQNILRSPTHAASLAVGSFPPAANKPRVSLTGNVTIMDEDYVQDPSIRDCYVERHPDAKGWLPENPIFQHTVS